ncbi:F0F1 ATP synthase subunit delta [Croceicoccus naphthovorans]|uniref:ATP synthase subunit delta n=1 Tax=Croceicoccus naphthovorans TaxID=1348774 RepID=A0A0G3XKG6_9SPHN|nr:F0F1 ATP synthase subunit delta [Croceicoccus naphthovorans]AKM11707.1 ATP synthase subunit delta [Croceicoccus naphthovorans]
MDNSGGITASLAGRYASALFDLAVDQNQVTAVEGDLDSLREAISATPELAALLKDPEISRRASGEAIVAVATHLGAADLTKKFLGTLAENRRLAKLPEMIRAFHAIAAAQRGEVTADVTSAHALTDTQIAALTAKLTAREGRDVKVRTSVDSSILGGLIVKIGSQQIDGSIRTRLNSLATAMKG